jgi:hypothetical protein
MPGAHEQLEHAEHATHAGHSGGNASFGVTMAILGALIAFCAAMVGSERNELTRTLIEQTQVHADYTASSTKFRLAMLELEKQKGRLTIARASGTTPENSGTDMGVVRRFLELATHYQAERKIFGILLDSYSPLVATRFDAAEGYERAQLVAEIGIVAASLAVLLGNRAVWLVSVALGLLCLGQLGLTAIHANTSVTKSIAELNRGEQEFDDFRARYPDGAEDDATLDAVDPGGVMRKDIEAHAAKMKAPAKPAPG